MSTAGRSVNDGGRPLARHAPVQTFVTHSDRWEGVMAARTDAQSASDVSTIAAATPLYQDVRRHPEPPGQTWTPIHAVLGHR